MIFAAANPTVSPKQPRPYRPAVRPRGAPRRPGPRKALRDTRRRRPRARQSSTNLRENSGHTFSIVSSIQASNARRSPGRALVAARGQIAHDEIAEHRAEIEPHRPVERELRIDHQRLALRHHDRSGVKIAVDQGFRMAHEFELEPRDRDVQVEVFAKGGGGRIEPGRRPAVLFGLAVGLGKDQVLGDLAQRVVAGERGDPLLLLGGRHRQVGAEEQGPRQKGRDVIDEAGITGPEISPLRMMMCGSSSSIAMRARASSW